MSIEERQREATERRKNGLRHNIDRQKKEVKRLLAVLTLNLEHMNFNAEADVLEYSPQYDAAEVIADELLKHITAINTQENLLKEYARRERAKHFNHEWED